VDDPVGRLGPAQVAEHHFARQNERSRIDLVEVGVLGRGAVGGLEDRAAGVVVDVGPRGDADPADACRQGIGHVVAVEVQGSNHVVFRRAGQDLLEERIGDHILHDELPARRRIGDFVPRTAIQRRGAELVARRGVAPIAEGAFGEFHDVALVDQGDALAAVGERIADGRPHEAPGALFGNRLDADAGAVRKADFPHAHFLPQECDKLVHLGGARRPLDAGVDVFRVFAEDDHVCLFRMGYGTGHPGKPAHRTQADVEVEFLPQGHV